MLNINTNISSLTVQNSLNKSTNALNQAIERMTTGFKINGAKDNAANFSISTNMSTKISAYMIAEDNASAGIDFVQTASSNLALMSDLGSRLRSLAEQAANGTYGKTSIQAINSEAASIINEIYRIKNSTTYNGIDIFGENAADSGEIGTDLKAGPSGFIEEVERRDTSSMTALASVDETQTLARGSYSISTAEELAKLATMQNAGLVEAGSEFVLTNDIDLSAYTENGGWKPIGGNNGYSNPFEGTFDGNGYKITNLYIDRPTNHCQGLFGYIEDAVIKNVGVEGNITAHSNSGGLVGLGGMNTLTSVVENCYADVDMDLANGGGGLLGAANVGKIVNCYATGDVVSKTWVVGGLAGRSKAKEVTNCYATGDVVCWDESSVIATGGLLGKQETTGAVISNCFTTGNVKSSGDTGGLVGNSSANGTVIQNCYTTGNVNGINLVGGLVGVTGSGSTVNIQNSYTIGDISGSGMNVGGIAGQGIRATISNCLVLGQINGNSRTGIFVGYSGVNTTVEESSYNGQLNQNLGLTGISSSTVNNVKDIYELADTSLQVGIDSNESSKITFNSFFALGGLRTIAVNGLEAEGTLEKIDQFLKEVNARQTDLGAIENRLTSSLEEIGIKYENLVSSRSTIRDADIAEESSQYIRNQILQQAAATLLATANQTPSLALQLI